MIKQALANGIKKKHLVALGCLVLTGSLVNDVIKNGIQQLTFYKIWWICVLGLFIYTIKKWMNQPKRTGQIVFAILVSLIQIVILNINANGTLNWFYRRELVLSTSVIVCLLAICIILVNFALEKIMCFQSGSNLTQNRESRNNYCTYTVAFLVMFAWLPFLINVYPGSYGWDTMFQLRQYNGIVPYSSSTPFLLTQIYGLIFNLFKKLFGTNQRGMFGIFLFQYIGMAFAIGHSIGTLERMGMSKRIKMVVFLGYVCIPMFPVFTTFCNKDTPFCIAFMLSISYAMRICTDGNGIYSIVNLIGLGVSLLCVTTFRLNGPMASISLGITVVVYLIVKHGVRHISKAITIIAIPIIGSFCMNGVANNSIGDAVGRSSSAASLTVKSLAYLQTANYVRKYPEDVSEEEKSILTQMWNYDKLPDYYSDFYVDIVRNNRICDNAEYWNVWKSMGQKHPEAYIEATIMMTGKFLYLFAPVDRYADLPMDDSTDGVLDGINVLSEEADARRWKFVNNYTNIVYNTPVKYISTTALYIFLTISMTITMISRKKRGFLVVGLPMIMMIISTLLSPAASTRYALPVICGVPMMFSLCRWECTRR